MPDELQGLNAEPRIVQTSAKTVSGLSRFFSMDERDEIPGLWMKLHQEAGAIVTQRTSYGVSHGFSKEGFHYLCGLEHTQDLPGAWDAVELPAGRYAVFTYDGPASGIGPAINTIWTQLVAQAKLTPASRPSFEVYDQRYSSRTSSGVVEFWIPLAG